MTVKAVRSHNVQDACALARRHLWLLLRNSQEVLRSGGEDRLYRVHLTDGTGVEVSLGQYRQRRGPGAMTFLCCGKPSYKWQTVVGALDPTSTALFRRWVVSHALPEVQAQRHHVGA